MLVEIGISNLAIIDQLRIELAPGFSVLTGETGAGKSIIIDAVGCLLGHRADTDMIRTGADRAYIEGIFRLEGEVEGRLRPLLDENGLEPEGGLLILSREINRSGRHACRINGRTVTLTTLRQVSQNLVDIHGQVDNHSLVQVRQHVHFLDRFAGLTDLRAQFAEAASSLQQARRELRSILRGERELARRVDLLEYQVSEITAAHLEPGEEESLRQERNRLANAERLIRLTAGAYAALSDGDREEASVLDHLNKVMRQVLDLERFDPAASPIREMLEESSALLEEVSSALREYRDELEFNPARLSQVENRLELIHDLERKYGDKIEDVLRYQEQALQELDGIAHQEERIAELNKAEVELLSRMGEIGESLSNARREAAKRLESGIEGELADLRMPDARFVVGIQRSEDEAGAPVGERRFAFDNTGLDRIEFQIAANLGEEPKPLATTASGGETSRLMLAMKSVLSMADATPTLIFDEIDAGIGGRVGQVVGQKLRRLAANHQVLVVTHLPQMAAYGDAHCRVAKVVRDGRTLTTVTQLEGSDRLEEIALMLGGSDSAATRRSAEEMLEHGQAGAETERGMAVSL